MYTSYSEIKSYELEISSRCNANCPDCSRNDPKLTLIEQDIKIDDFKKWFPKKYIKDKRFDFCGTLGDAIVNKDCLPIVDYLNTNECELCVIVTNGSARKSEFWQELAKKADAIFSIDGLEDTNHIYRKRTNWNKIIENVSSFINAGGYATWEYLIFDHNKHQMDQAKILAKKLGFSKIVFKKSARKYRMGKDTRPHENTNHFEKLVQQYEIQCAWKNGNEFTPRIFISSLGKVWPCCHFATSPIALKRLASEYDTNFNDLYTHTLEKILNHDFLKNNLEKSWASNNKYFCCALKCNVKTGNIGWRKNDRKVTF